MGQNLITERGSDISWELLLGEEGKVAGKGPETEAETQWVDVHGRGNWDLIGMLAYDWYWPPHLKILGAPNVHRVFQPQLRPIHSQLSHIFSFFPTSSKGPRCDQQQQQQSKAKTAGLPLANYISSQCLFFVSSLIHQLFSWPYSCLSLRSLLNFPRSGILT